MRQIEILVVFPSRCCIIESDAMPWLLHSRLFDLDTVRTTPLPLDWWTGFVVRYNYPENFR